MSVERMIKTAIETGRVIFGVRECRRAIAQNQVKLLVLATNCPYEDMRNENLKSFNFRGTNVELGQACGKPFPISVLAVLEEGSSNILSLA